MRPPGWKKDPVWRAYHEMKLRERYERLLDRHQLQLQVQQMEEQMRAVDEAAQQIVQHEASKVPKDAIKH